VGDQQAKHQEDQQPSPDGRRLLPLLSRRTATGDVQNACYFRSGPEDGQRKALVKITDRCDLHCAHCFVSATRLGADMPAAALNPAVMSRFADARVANVTLTGGEPFVHPELLQFAKTFVASGMDVTICTNGVAVTELAIQRLQELGRVRVNVSLDGGTEGSHGRFRGDRGSFKTTMSNTRKLAAAGLLKGILCTPNALGTPDEYADLYGLAAELGADYFLMNPLSSFGRGIKTRRRLEADVRLMMQTQAAVAIRVNRTDGPEGVFVRFPQQAGPLSPCIAGDILYVFVNGDVTVCPYLVFAAHNPRSQHSVAEFVVGNLFEDDHIAAKLDDYKLEERYALGNNASCKSCDLDGSCGKGCPAAVITAGGRIGELDAEVCPVAGGGSAAACL
jgi:radical SAM protein with 4Fe4S-binding SPASM domain